MVARIKPSESFRNSLNYNETKLRQGVATFFHSSGFAKDTDQLGFTDKIRTLEKRAELNERTKVNCLHISLNFHPSEKLTEETLRRIADTYMQKIGFGDQPYLVYQHHDVGHPHIHLVTTNIQRNGKRIKLHNIGRNQSEKARKSIEKEFNLVRADKTQRLAYELKPVNAQKVQYGRSETKQAITNVLNAILPTYKYASLPELNAALRSYNVLADPGSKDSRIYKNKGLVYRVLDDKGSKVGVPIKASHIYNKPTLKFLEQKFTENEASRQKHKLRVKNAIDLAILRQPGLSVPDLARALQKENIQLVLRQNTDGIIYGLTYLDHKTKCVFNGSNLGKPYSANQVQARCSNSMAQALKNTDQPVHLQLPNVNPLKEIIEELMQPEQEGPLAAELREELKRKRRRRLRH